MRIRAFHLVGVLAGYSRRARPKLDDLYTVRDAIEHVLSGKSRPPAAKDHRPSRRYRIADCFTSDELAQLVARYRAGETSTALAREARIAKSTFLRLLAEHGVDVRTRGLTPAKEREILRLRSQGMIIRDIARRVGCSYDSARQFLLTGPST